MHLKTKENLRQWAKRELANRDFWEFCLYCDREFFTKRKFLKKIADAFMRIHSGKILTLSVSMPPRAGKSYITSLYCAWALGKDAEGSIMRNTCTATLYDKFSYDVRAILKSDKFKEVFDATLAEDRQALEGWRLKTSKQVAYFGAGVGGTIIGFGATIVAITDDLYKSYSDAMSQTVNDKTHTWKDSAHNSRLEKNCPQIDIGTRWTKKDVIGKNIEEGQYDESIVIPALIKGKSFCEDVKTTKEYLKIKDRLDEVIWSAEYMQEPTEKIGLVFYEPDLNKFSLTEGLKEDFESSLGYTDVADQGTDYLCQAIGHNIGPNFYITDFIFTKQNTDVTEPLCANSLAKEQVKYCRIESNNQGHGFGRRIQKLLTTTKVLLINNNTNKHSRIIMEAGNVRKYFYFLRKEERSPMYQSAMDNLCSYPYEGKVLNDDAPDAVTGLSVLVQSFMKHLYK